MIINIIPINTNKLFQSFNTALFLEYHINKEFLNKNQMGKA